LVKVRRKKVRWLWSYSWGKKHEGLFCCVEKKTHNKKAKTRARLWKAREHSMLFPATQSTTQVNALLFVFFFSYLRKHCTVSNETKTNKLSELFPMKWCLLRIFWCSGCIGNK
jgi:hypothetical protein